MKSLYFDTNIFIYLATKTSPYFKKTSEIIKFCKSKKIAILSSTETIQEIIHYGKIMKQLALGIKIANKALDIIDVLIPTDKELMIQYLELVKRYIDRTKIDSRDFIHFISGISGNADFMISYDKELKKFKEIETLTPDEFLNKFKS